MADEYSIEERAPSIHYPCTRKRFQEVLGCYSSGNYRSSVIALWCVALCDLFLKLQKLEELGDEKAREILTAVKEEHAQNRNSPAWETKLIKLAFDRTELLDRFGYENLQKLQKTRNLAAHPTFNHDLHLFPLDKVTVFLLIRDTLEDLLTKPPFLSGTAFAKLIKDLDEKSNILTDDEQLKSYLFNGYYNYFNIKLQQDVFKKFWKFLFNLDDDKSEKNRAINYRAFLLLFYENPSIFEKQIEDQKDYFNQIKTEGSPVVYLVRFLARQPNIYKLLDSQARPAIDNTIETVPLARCLAHFTSQNPHGHAEKLDKWIREESPEIEEVVWDELKSTPHFPGWIKTFIHLANTYYGASMDCDTADKRFGAIRILLEEYDKSDLIDLMQKIDENSQTYDRKHAQTDHEQIVSRMKEVNPSFDFRQIKAFSGYR